MFCWGSTVHGELGLGGIEDETILVPRKVDFSRATAIECIVCGDNYSIVLTRDGKIYSCGNNDYGQLGHEKPRRSFQMIPGIDSFVFKKAACGSKHTMALNEWGQLFCWGANSHGQLGCDSRNSVENKPSMVKALGTKVVIQIACGQAHTLALTNNGELYSWGSNADGQLGLNTSVLNSSKPTLIKSLLSVPIRSIACGGYHSVIVTKSGSVYVWGRNTFGQLGVDGQQNINEPCELSALQRAKVCYISCGEDFSAFLTRNGGVWTCGAGSYGQLGHGSNSNEILPRQIMNLMGTVVTQISCGRRHMLALVPSRGRVYAWGSGGAGQLGAGVILSVTVPQIVPGPWVSSNGSTIGKNDDNNPKNEISIDCVVRHIFAGGNHCFVTITQKKENIEPDDCRVPSSQILTITQTEIDACKQISEGDPVDGDLMSHLETVFKSQACMNASFLYNDDDLLFIDSGVEVEQAVDVYAAIAEIKNTTISELIYSSITEGLLPSLVPSPRSIECLRVYLTLPLYEPFMVPENYPYLQSKFARSAMELGREFKDILGSWWRKVPRIFKRLIMIYKKNVVHIMKNESSRNYVWNNSLLIAFEFLLLLYNINRQNNDFIFPYDTFHIPELKDLTDIRENYVEWSMAKSKGLELHLCNYPFAFDVRAKSILLQADQEMQMQTAMYVAGVTLISRMMNEWPTNASTLDQFVILNVSRENLVEDTLRQLSNYHPNELKKPLKVKFHGEEAEDAGGVKKEFFMLLLKEILDPKYGMFKEYEKSRVLWFSDECLEENTMYSLIGLLCGLAVYNFIIIDLHFPLALYKKLLNEPVGLTDLKEIDPVEAAGLQALLDYEEEDLSDVFTVEFVCRKEAFGKVKVEELIPGGKKIPVTQDNKKEFVDLYVDYILNKSVEARYKYFHDGFYKVCSGQAIGFFQGSELMALVVGNEDYNWITLQETAVYKNGYTKDDPTIVLFWDVFHELSLEEKKKFLLFLTGSDRIPVLGMSEVKIIIQAVNDERSLPVAHTCFNLLDLPRYQTREKLKYKLLQAIQQTHGFSLV